MREVREIGDLMSMVMRVSRSARCQMALVELDLEGLIKILKYGYGGALSIGDWVLDMVYRVKLVEVEEG